MEKTGRVSPEPAGPAAYNFRSNHSWAQRCSISCGSYAFGISRVMEVNPRLYGRVRRPVKPLENCFARRRVPGRLKFRPVPPPSHPRASRRLTPARWMAIVKCMCKRGLICLAIVVSVCLVGIAFLPAGSGPYTAVYGPASALRAQRAVLLLALAISYLAMVFAVLSALGSSLFDAFGSLVPVRDCSSPSPLIAGLRC